MQKKRPDVSRTWTRDQHSILTDFTMSHLSGLNTRNPHSRLATWPLPANYDYVVI